MLDLYAFATPNSLKPVIALEELALPYRLHAVNIRQGEQKTDAFRALNINGKVPVLVDDADGGAPFVLSESAAILVHLAEKTGRLAPTSGTARARVFEQLFFHASGLSPAFGNAGYFGKLAPEPIPHAIERFGGEARRLLGVLDHWLADRPFAAGDDFTIADIAHFGWLWRRAFVGIDFDATPNVARWYAQIEARPAVQRAIAATSALAPA